MRCRSSTLWDMPQVSLGLMSRAESDTSHLVAGSGRLRLAFPHPSAMRTSHSSCSAFPLRATHHPSSRHPTEPQCSYDPVDGLPIAPDVDPAERMRILEEQICAYTVALGLAHMPTVTTRHFSTAQLRSQLNEARNFNSRSASPSQNLLYTHHRIASAVSVATSPSSRSPTDNSPNGNAGTLLHGPGDSANSVSADSPDSQLRGSTSSPEILQATNGHVGDTIIMDMLFSGWDPDLPEPEVLNHW